MEDRRSAPVKASDRDHPACSAKRLRQERELARLRHERAGAVPDLEVLFVVAVDQVARREKSQTVYPEFAGLSQAMEQESRDFIEEVLVRSSGTLTELLTADWTIADPALAVAYGVSPAGQGARTSLSSVKRRGILSQAAFLSVFATNGGSHPVFRGVALMRRVVGDDMGVKASGGVRDLEQMKAMVAAGATRIGASAGVRIVRESRGEAPATAKASGY